MLGLNRKYLFNVKGMMMSLIPRISPKALLPDALAIYKRGIPYPYSVEIVTEEDRLAAEDVVAAGLGRLSSYSDGTVHLTVVRTAGNLVIADDEAPVTDDSQSRLVAVVRATINDESVVMAVLKGAQVTFTSQNGMPVAAVSVLHSSGTDVEHDASYIAKLTVLSPVMQFIRDCGTSFVGFLTESRLYPAGVDPKTVGNANIDPSEVCEEKDCSNGINHPIIPPLGAIKNIPVEITIYNENELTKSEVN